MLGSWGNFTIAVLADVLLFCASVGVVSRRDVFVLLGRGVLIGVPFGLSFDLVVGKYAGLSSYALGFTPLFLALNAAFAYGIFAANALVFRRTGTACAWAVCAMTVSEGLNQLFRVWTWHFTLAPLPYLAVLSLGYIGGTLFVRGIGRLVFRPA